MNQKAKILQYLKTHKRITPWSAMYELGCLRLSERIRELEAEGMVFYRERLRKQGKGCMSYSLLQLPKRCRVKT